MASKPFKAVDVFTTVRFKGNPVAVVLDGNGISTEQMLQIASWTNLSETTFVIPTTATGADYNVRIFNPGRLELPFAGHPTIGTAHALLEAGMVEPKDGVLVQECKAGLIKLTVEHAGDGTRWISFDLPKPKFTAMDAAQKKELEVILGAPLKTPYVVDVGPLWVVAQLSSAQAVLEARPDFQRMAVQDSKGGYLGVIIFGAYSPGNKARIEVRAFAPAHGVNEDPVCGSGCGATAAYIRHTGQVKEFGNDFLASQGQIIGRAGILRLSISEEIIRVSGNAVTCVDGKLSL